MYNKYPEEFKQDTVALIRSRYGIRNIANMLSVSATTIVHWTKDARYLAALSANPDVLISRPPYGRGPNSTKACRLLRAQT